MASIGMMPAKINSESAPPMASLDARGVPLPPVVIPAGTPGPDGVVRQYPVYDDAMDLLYDPEPRPYPPVPPPPTMRQRVQRLEERADRSDDVAELLAGQIDTLRGRGAG
jgi:hypothetical protein